MLQVTTLMVEKKMKIIINLKGLHSHKNNKTQKKSKISRAIFFLLSCNLSLSQSIQTKFIITPNQQNNSTTNLSPLDLLVIFILHLVNICFLIVISVFAPRAIIEVIHLTRNNIVRSTALLLYMPLNSSES